MASHLEVPSRQHLVGRGIDSRSMAERPVRRREDRGEKPLALSWKARSLWQQVSRDMLELQCQAGGNPSSGWDSIHSSKQAPPELEAPHCHGYGNRDKGRFWLQGWCTIKPSRRPPIRSRKAGVPDLLEREKYDASKPPDASSPGTRERPNA